MHIMLLSVSHRTAGVALREQLALSEERLTSAINRLRERYPHAEAVVLCTCNRTELYLARPPLESPTLDELQDDLAVCCGVAPETLANVVAKLENQDAVAHLFRVATGLESMVLGEPHVLGQVKRAYEAADKLGGVGAVFHRVFQQAISVAKQVRNTTGIDKGRVSVGSVAVDFARRIFDHFDDKTVVGIGAGELAKPMLQYLKRLQPAKLWLVNRSVDRAGKLVSALQLDPANGGARPFDDLQTLLVEADIVLTSTGAERPIITAADFKPLLRKRRGRPLFVVDIAVPRDVEPAVGDLNNVYLYNIDDLQRVVETTHDRRGEQVQACEAQLAETVAACISQVQQQDIGQLIRSLRRQLHSLGQAEMQRTARKLAACQDSQQLERLLEEHTQRLINKVLHLPLSQLDHSQQDATLGFYAAALRSLFGLEEDDQHESDDVVADNSDDTDHTQPQADEPTRPTIKKSTPPQRRRAIG